MSLYGKESKCRTQSCLHFWAISSVRLLTVKPTLAVSAGNDDSTRKEAQVQYVINDTRIKACTSVRRQRLHQTRISESGEPQNGSTQLRSVYRVNGFGQ